MHTRFRSFLWMSIVIIISLFISMCENDYPGSLWDTVGTSKPQPVLTSIVPADSAYAGVGQIIINGQNFSANPEENLVFFNGTRATVVAASETQLTILPPNIVGDSLAIKIAVHRAELFSEVVYYKLKAAVSVIGNLAENGDMAYAMAVDKDENVYVSIEGKIIKKIAPDGTTTHFADVTFLKATGMKMGPDNTLYACFAAGRVRKIATIASDGTEGTYVTLSGKPNDFDFDANGNIWVTVGKELWLVKTDKSKSLAKTMPIDLGTVRVFNDALYVSGRDETSGEAKIWRLPISGESLGTEEVVLDLGAGTPYQDIILYSFTFDADGIMYLCTDNSDAILTYDPSSGTAETLYPGLFSPLIYEMTWGDGNIAYAVQQPGTASNVLRIDLGKKGAPYFGRK